MKIQVLSRRLLMAALIAAVSLTVVGQKTSSQHAPSIDRLRAHIEYLASDKLEGRRTGTPGANLAAEYIAREFSRYGLRRSIGRDLPGMSILEADSPKRYLQEFPYVAGVELGKDNWLSADAPKFGVSMGGARIGQDFSPLGFSSNARLDKTPVAFVGFGIGTEIVTVVLLVAFFKRRGWF